MQFIKKRMESFRKFTLRDIAVFETCLFAIGIVLAKLIPAVLSLSMYYYIIFVVLWSAIILPAVYKKNAIKWSRVRYNFTHLSIWKLGVYKILVLVAAFLFLKLIPALMLVDIARYVAIAFFGIGYLMAAMYRK